MLRIQVFKKLISIFVISFIFLFVIGSGEIMGSVSTESCERAYENCIWLYGGYLPSPYNLHALGYCGIGLAFCLLYM
jgi:hypothetical protein